MILVPSQGVYSDTSNSPNNKLLSIYYGKLKYVQQQCAYTNTAVAAQSTAHCVYLVTRNSLWTGTHNRTGLSCTLLCDGPIKHVYLIEEVHSYTCVGDTGSFTRTCTQYPSLHCHTLHDTILTVDSDPFVEIFSLW